MWVKQPTLIENSLGERSQEAVTDFPAFPRPPFILHTAPNFTFLKQISSPPSCKPPAATPCFIKYKCLGLAFEALHCLAVTFLVQLRVLLLAFTNPPSGSRGIGSVILKSRWKGAAATGIG